jgi:hypothetical protein
MNIYDEHDGPPAPGFETAIFEAAAYAVAGIYARALLRILDQPWRQSEWVGGRTGIERGPCITCPGCGLSTDPRDGLWLRTDYHYNLPKLCPWLLAAQTLLGMEGTT